MPLPDDPFDDAVLRDALADALGFRPRPFGPAGAQRYWAFERRRGGLRRVEVAPAGLYAAIGAGEALAALAAATRHAPATRVALHLNPVDPDAGRVSARIAALGFRVVEHETHLLRLDRPVEALRAGYHATKRAQAQRRVVVPSQIVRATDAAQVDDYLAVYAASLQRWGRADMPYPAALFRRLIASGTARIWLHYVHGRLACGVVLLVCRHYALYWQGVSRIDDDQKPAFPMVRLMDHVIGGLVEEGIPVLNLGASEGLPNVRRFKEEFGATAAAYPTLVHEGALWRLAQAARGVLRRGQA